MSNARLARQEGLLAHFGRRRAEARRRYGQFVRDGMGQASVWTALRQPIDLGDATFVERMQRRAQVQGDARSMPRAQRRGPAPSWAAIAATHRGRDPAIMVTYATGAYSYRDIAAHFGLHRTTVGRVCAAEC